MGILNAHQRFFLSALAPGMYQLGWILRALVLAPRYGVLWSFVWYLDRRQLSSVGTNSALVKLPQAKYALELVELTGSS
jgi:hypothetical protein